MPTITIELTAQQATRLQTAWEAQFGVLPTVADVKTHLVRELKAIVLEGEKKIAEAAVQEASPFNPT